MTNSAFAFHSVRSHAEAAVPTRPRRWGGALQALHRHFAVKRFAAAPRQHERRLETDAYLDRSGLSSVDWAEALTRHAQR